MSVEQIFRFCCDAPNCKKEILQVNRSLEKTADWVSTNAVAAGRDELHACCSKHLALAVLAYLNMREAVDILAKAFGEPTAEPLSVCRVCQLPSPKEDGLPNG